MSKKTKRNIPDIGIIEQGDVIIDDEHITIMEGTMTPAIIKKHYNSVYAPIFQKSIEDWQGKLTDEEKDALTGFVKQSLGDLYNTVEGWLPYSLLLESTNDKVKTITIQWHMAALDLDDLIAASRVKSKLELDELRRTADALVDPEDD